MKTQFFKPNSLRTQLTLALAGAVMLGALTPWLLAALWSTPGGSGLGSVPMLFVVTLFLAAALVVSRLLAQTLLAPLEVLAQAAKIMTSDVSVMVPVPTQTTTELVPVVQAINTLHLALADASSTFEPIFLS